MQRLFLILSLFFCISANDAFSVIKSDILVYIDCHDCNFDQIRNEIQYVNYTHDPKAANVHILVTEQSTGGGGRQYRFHFIGLNTLKNINYELEYDAESYKTDAEIQEEMVRILKSGLTPFMAASGQEMEINGIMKKDTAINSGDKWNFWVFEVEGDMDLSKELSKKEYELEGDIDIEKTTQDWRIRSSFEYSYEETGISKDEIDFYSSIDRYWMDLSVVKSLGEHKSAGVFTSGYSDPSRNTDLAGKFSLAMEYNFYPYRLSYKKEFTIAYYIGMHQYIYLSETIFDKTRESLMGHSLHLNYEYLDTWGEIELRLEANQFLHDMEKNSFEFEIDLSVRIIKGLSVYFDFEGEFIHDQLYIAKGDASIEEILLERKALATDFNMYFSVGLAYRFGSIYNNIVNTRL